MKVEETLKTLRNIAIIFAILGGYTLFEKEGTFNASLYGFIFGGLGGLAITSMTMLFWNIIKGCFN